MVQTNLHLGSKGQLRPALSLPEKAKCTVNFGNSPFRFPPAPNSGIQPFSNSTSSLTAPPNVPSDQLEALPTDVLRLIISSITDSSALALLSTNRRFALFSSSDYDLWRDMFFSTWKARYPTHPESARPLNHILTEREEGNTPLQHWHFEEMRQAARDLLNGIFLYSSNCAYGDIYCTNVWKGPGLWRQPLVTNERDKTGISIHSSVMVHDGERSYMRKYSGSVYVGQDVGTCDVVWRRDPAPSEATPVAVDPLRKLFFVSHAAKPGSISLHDGRTGEVLSSVEVNGYVAANFYGIYHQTWQRLFVQISGTTLICVDASNPKEIRLVWEQNGHAYGQGGIVFTHAGAIVRCTSNMTAFNPWDGQVLWRSKPLPHAQCLATCDRRTGNLIMPSNTPTIVGINPFTGVDVWRRDVTNLIDKSVIFGFGSVLSHPNGKIYVWLRPWSSAAFIDVLDPATGHFIERIADGATGSSSGQLFCDSHGRMYLNGSSLVQVDAKGETLWKTSCSTSLGNHSAFIDPLTMFITNRSDSGGNYFRC